MLALILCLLSLLALAAHFLRMGSISLAVACLLLIGVLLTPRAWAARVVQVALLLGAAEWGFTLLNVVRDRLEDGRPFARAALILGVVGGLCVISAWQLQARVRRLRPPRGPAQPGVNR